MYNDDRWEGAARLFIEYYPAHFKGVPLEEKYRHHSQFVMTTKWLKWVDDGLSARANVGSKKARSVLPPSLRGD